MAEEQMVEEEVKEEVVQENEEEGVEVKKAQKLSGEQDMARNTEAMAVAKKEAENLPEEEEKKYPSFFVEPEKKHKIELDVLFDKKTGKILSVSRTGLGIDFEKFQYLGHVEEWVEFTQPTYDDIATYRQQASVFNQDAGKVLVDAVQMRNFLIMWHLKGWSLKNSDGSPVNLGHDEDGSLSADSIKKVYELFPTLVDVIMTLFENEVLLR
jgi:hypothetical protein